MKICHSCKNEKPLQEFHKRKSGKFGVFGSCKTCRKLGIKAIIPDNTHNPNKTCSKCKIEKPKNEFHKTKKIKDGFKSDCKECRKKEASSFYKKNKLSIDERNRKYFLENKDKIKIRQKKYEKKFRNNYRKNRAKTDPIFRIRINLRARIKSAIKGNYKSGSAVRDLGCSILELKQYLESKFQPGMSWENYGRNGWHIDHIIPLSSFDLTDREQFKKACHYTNLQPLWAEENLKKSNKTCCSLSA